MRDKLDQLDIYKNRLKIEQEFVKEATERALQQRIAIVLYILIGMPEEYISQLIAISNRSLAYVEKMNKCVAKLEDTILALETIASSTQDAIVSKLDELYASTDRTKYDKFLYHVKSEGLRVFRNSQGLHQVIWKHNGN